MAGAERLAELEAENARLVAEVARLVGENAVLAERLARLERDATRTSSNSSKPPSADPQVERESRAARRRSQREADRGKARRNQGGQPGAPGAHLAKVGDPDEVVRHAPPSCCGCGAGLDGAPVEGEERRQVFDLPRRRVLVTEHVAERPAGR